LCKRLLQTGESALSPEIKRRYWFTFLAHGTLLPHSDRCLKMLARAVCHDVLHSDHSLLIIEEHRRCQQAHGCREIRAGSLAVAFKQVAITSLLHKPGGHMPFNGANAAAQAANEAGSGQRRRMLRNGGQGLILLQIQVCPPSSFMRGRRNRPNLKPKLNRDCSFRIAQVQENQPRADPAALARRAPHLPFPWASLICRAIPQADFMRLLIQGSAPVARFASLHMIRRGSTGQG
jgi:hypothetical protein